MTSAADITRSPAVASAGATNIRWTHIAPSLLVVWIISMFDKSNMAIVMNDQGFLQELGLSGQQGKLGWLSSALFLAYGICAPLWGYVVHRYGARITCVLSLVIWALTCFWSGLAANYESLLVSRAVLGAGEAALYPLTLALVANWFALKERGRATSFWWIGTMIGPMLVGLIITGLIVAVGWRWQFHAMGVLALVLPLPMIWFLVADKPEQHPGANAGEAELVRLGSLENNEDAPGQAMKSVANIWTSYRFWLATIAISSNAIFFWGWSIWLPTYLRTVRQFSFSTSGYLTFIIFGFAVATILAVGYFSDKVFRRAPLAGVGWFFAAIFLMGAALAPSTVLSVILMICALCAQQVGIACAEMLMHSVVGAADMGKTQGVRAFVTQIVGALSPAMIGYIVQMTGGFTGAFAVLSIAVVISAGCMITLAREGF
jgi:ACS family glucarate transporter-like MFS transporter